MNEAFNETPVLNFFELKRTIVVNDELASFEKMVTNIWWKVDPFSQLS